MNPDKWQPSASLATLQQRAQLVKTIRQFFAVRNVMEVSTPVVVASGVSDPHLDSFELQRATGYLRTSPEYAMKRLLAAGSGDIYELGPVFRLAESGRWHNPEFSMLEWYRVGWHYHQLIDEVIELLTTCSPQLFALWPVAKISYTALSQQVLGLDIANTDTTHLIKIAYNHGWHADPDQTTKSLLLDFIFSHMLQPALATESINIVYDFPCCQAALAKIHGEPGNPPVAQRFEVFLGQLELANGYQELTDATEQLQRFIEDQRLREKLGKPAISADKRLLDAIRHGLPDCAGVALGVDRLLACNAGHKDLADTQAFNWHRR